ncbi:MAG: PhzF family phenazine biosynthesis protein [Rhodobacterales bacterium]|nr:PhzF family phenazine biosynthesis protein [Rhodobacterales bacterium]
MSTTVTLYQIDAFTQSVFGGNPAAICPLNAWLPEPVMQAMATENNLSETAFFVIRDDGHYHIRWFTPAAEIDLAGHPTLAAAWLILERLAPGRDQVVFHTQRGDTLTVTRMDGGMLSMDFPSRPPAPWTPNRDLEPIIGQPPLEVQANDRDVLVRLPDAAAVRAVTVDQNALLGVDRELLLVTAPGDDCDFVSRVFAPKHGVPEDPVTGSAHCTLIPFWAGRLGKDEMLARQVSARGGELRVGLAGNRVRIAGHAVLYMVGEVLLP